MKILLTVLLISTIISAQNIYDIQPGVKHNQIVLKLSNLSSIESAKNIEVKIFRNSKNLTFNRTEKMIENITQDSETEVTFNFDVDYNIGKAEADTIEFLITDNKSVYQTREFILRYAVPTEYKLVQNYPNPFNPTTKIRYSIPSTSLSLGKGLGVRLIVYDILGNQVTTLVNEEKEPGYYEVEFDASSFASGVYIYRLQAGAHVFTKKMLVLK
jgi:hypothetical protein